MFKDNAVPESFDPLQVWLGIPKTEQPVNHYRLLGLPLYEDDRARIEDAARNVQKELGQHSTERPKDFARLSNLVREARECLLSSDRKKSYDSKLKAALSLGAMLPATAEPARPHVPESNPDATEKAKREITKQVSTPTSANPNSRGRLGLILGALAASLAVAASLWLTSQLPRNDDDNPGSIYEVAPPPNVKTTPGEPKNQGNEAIDRKTPSESGTSKNSTNPDNSQVSAPIKPGEPTPVIPRDKPFTEDRESTSMTKPPSVASKDSTKPIDPAVKNNSKPLGPEVDPIFSKLPQGPRLDAGESRVLLGHRGVVRHVKISRDGKGAITAGDDGTIRFWNVRDGKTLRVLEGSIPDCRGLAMSSNGRVLAIGLPGKVIVWTPESDAKVELTPERMVPSALAASNDGPHVFVGMQSGEVHMYLTPVKDVVERFQGLTAPVVSLAVSEDDGFVAAGSADGTVAVWDTRSGRLFWRFRCTEVPSAVALSDDGSVVAAAGFHHVIVWLVTNGARVKAVPTEVPARQVRSIEFANRGHSLFYSLGNTGKVWHLLSMESMPVESTNGVLCGLPDIKTWFSVPDNASASSKPADLAPRIWSTKTPGEPTLVKDPETFRWSALPDTAWPTTLPTETARDLAREELKNELGDVDAVHEEQAKSQGENCLESANQSLADPPRRYELLVRAGQLLTRGQAIPEREQVLKELSSAFSDVSPVMIAALRCSFDWKPTGPAEQNDDQSLAATSLIPQLVSRNQFRHAEALIPLLPQKGATGLDPQLIPWSLNSQQYAKLWQARFDEMLALEARIAVDRQDRIAHDRLGDWLAVQGRWQDALTHWEQGSRDNIRKWAEADRAANRDVEAWKAVAENWQNAASLFQEPLKTTLLARARHAVSLALLTNPSAKELSLQKLPGVSAMLPVRIELTGSATLNWNAAELSLTSEEGTVIDSLTIGGVPIPFKNPSLFVSGTLESPLPMGLNPEGAKLLQRRGPTNLKVNATPLTWSVEIPGARSKKYFYDFVLLFGKPMPLR